MASQCFIHGINSSSKNGSALLRGQYIYGPYQDDTLQPANELISPYIVSSSTSFSFSLKHFLSSKNGAQLLPLYLTKHLMKKVKHLFLLLLPVPKKMTHDAFVRCTARKTLTAKFQSHWAKEKVLNYGAHSGFQHECIVSVLYLIILKIKEM